MRPDGPVKYYSPHTSVCIIRTSRDHYRTVWAALSMLSSVSGERLLAHVVRCSGPLSPPHPSSFYSNQWLTTVCAGEGTIKKIQQATIAYNRRLVATVAAYESRPVPSASAPPAPVIAAAGGAAAEKEGAPAFVLPEGEGGWEGWEEREKAVLEGMAD